MYSFRSLSIAAALLGAVVLASPLMAAGAGAHSGAQQPTYSRATNQEQVAAHFGGGHRGYGGGGFRHGYGGGYHHYGYGYGYYPRSYYNYGYGYPYYDNYYYDSYPYDSYYYYNQPYYYNYYPYRSSGIYFRFGG